MQDCRIHVTSVLCLLFTFVFLKKWWSQRPLGKPLLQNMFFHGFGSKKKRLQGLTGLTILWQALSGKWKSFGRFWFKTNRLQAFTDHTVLGQALSGKKSFPRFWLKKIQLSAVTPLSGHTASANPRFWFKKVLV